MTKKMSRILSVTVIVLMLLIVYISPPLISAMQSNVKTKSSPYNSIPSADSSNWSPRNITESYTNRYLELFGINKNNSVKETETYEKEERASGDIITDFSKSSKYTLETPEGPKTASMNDALSLDPDKTASSYQYTADLSIADSEKYEIFESQSRTTLKGQTTIETHQKIGGSINYSMDSTETKKRIGNLVEKQNTVSVDYINSSGSFYLNIAGSSVWNENETAILDGTFTVDQNLYNPLGQYTFQFTQLENASGTKILVTIPNGTIVDPILLECDDEVQEFSYGGDYYYVYHLKSYYVYWTLAEQVTAKFISQALGDLLTALFGPVGISFQIIEAVIEVLIDFTFTASDDKVYNYYTAIDWELWVFEPNYWFWYLFDSGPYMGETGYRTDTFMDQYLHNWIFFPFCFSGRYAHTSAWPATSGDEVDIPFCISSTSYSVFGSGTVTNDDYLCGSDDDDFARIRATGDYGDGANIVGQMNSYNSYGTIELRLSVEDPVRIYVYTAPTSNGPWTLKRQTDRYPTSAFWLRCGGYSGGFSYIAIACVKFTGSEADVYLDSVRVIHPPSPLSS